MDPKDTPAADWTAAAAEPDYPLPLPGGLTMLFRRIPKGSFLMGSRGFSTHEEPIHRVVIQDDFWLGKFVVTQAQYAAVVRGCPGLELDPDPSNFKGATRPVEQVSWDDVTAWCAALAGWAGLPKDVVAIRLPLEAEWEYACRAGTETEYYSGDGAAALAQVGWFEDNSGKQTHEVDEKPETHPAGLHGMHGNVWEWCLDVSDKNAPRKRHFVWAAREWKLADAGGDVTYSFDPIKPDQAPNRVLRGGSWECSARGGRSAARDSGKPDVRYWFFGFRVCLVRGPVPQPAGQQAAESERGAEGARE